MRVRFLPEQARYGLESAVYAGERQGIFSVVPEARGLLFCAFAEAVQDDEAEPSGEGLQVVSGHGAMWLDDLKIKSADVMRSGVKVMPAGAAGNLQLDRRRDGAHQAREAVTCCRVSADIGKAPFSPWYGVKSGL